MAGTLGDLSITPPGMQMPGDNRVRLALIAQLNAMRQRQAQQQQPSMQWKAMFYAARPTVR